MKDFYLKPKFFSVMKNYSGKQLTKDLTAGVIVAIIALPLSIALALASGVEPACGVYTAIAAGFVVSFLGGSRVQIAGPTAAFATVVAGIVATQGMDGLFLATVIAGIMLILMGVFKLGSLINNSRLHRRYRSHNLYRSDKGLPRTYICRRRKAH